MQTHTGLPTNHRVRDVVPLVTHSTPDKFFTTKTALTTLATEQSHLIHKRSFQKPIFQFFGGRQGLLRLVFAKTARVVLCVVYQKRRAETNYQVGRQSQRRLLSYP